MSKLIPSSTCLSLSLLLFLLAGCGRDEIKVYRVSKEEPMTPPPAQPHDHGSDESLPPGHPPMNAPAPAKITWTLPAGWQEARPGQMSRATFNITNETGVAQVNVTPLRGLAGKEVPIVNMWRQQVGQSELSPEEAAAQLKPVEIGGQPGKMFDVTGKADGAPMRIVTAMMHRDGTSWFFKLAGDDAVAEAQKPAFLEFLKSIKFVDEPAVDAGLPPMGAPPAADAEPPPEGKFKWQVPEGWKAAAPGQMQLAKYSVPEVNGAKADVMISAFPNSTGGIPGNVNRWRNQIGLPPAGDTELALIVKPLDTGIPESVIVDMVSGKRQLIGAIVPRDGQWYFYKLMGDAEAVAPQKEAFIGFAKSKP